MLVLAAGYSERIEEEAISAGARGFVLKTSSEDRLLGAIESLARGETCFVREASCSRGERTGRGGACLQAQGAGLTSREIEITQLLAEGKTNWCTATILGISDRTVETHRADIMRKLGLQPVVELVHYAVRNRLVEPLPPPAAVLTHLGGSAGSGR